eukprot:gene3724-4638_t
MPCILKVRIIEGRDLPIMDRSSALADAYVEIRCGQNESQKTDIQRKTLNPVWNQDFRFDFPNEADIQDKPLDIRVWDYDLVSKNDMIGTVLIDLNCLLDSVDGNSQIHGWFPIYDTLRGIRGELLVSAKLEKIQNANPFKDASDGILFFSISTPFSNYRIINIHSFVEELIVENDPEYHWTDTFRASRLSNFERQYLLYTLSGKLRRQMGKKVFDMGGNAVLGYKQCFDLEGDSGIVARGYGTAVTLRKVNESDTLSPYYQSPRFQSSSSYTSTSTSTSDSDSNAANTNNIGFGLSIEKYNVPDVQLYTLSTFQSRVLVHIGGVVSTKSVKILKKSNTQETRDIYWTEIRNEIKNHAKSLGCNFIVGYSETTTIQQSEDLCIFSATGTAVVLDLTNITPQSNYPIFTRKMSRVEDSSEADGPGSLKKTSIISGSAGGIGSGLSNMPNMGNNATMSTAITNSNISGGQLAATKKRSIARSGSLSGSVDDIMDDFNAMDIRNSNINNQTTTTSSSARVSRDSSAVHHHHHHHHHTKKRGSKARDGCWICHVPYPHYSSPFSVQPVRCNMCKRNYVPEILLATIEPPPGLPITGVGSLIQARVCRLKKKLQGESGATQLSDTIPFIEYDLHSQLMYKLKLLGMNAAFGLKTQITFSDTLVIGVATATALFVSALPAPPVLHISRSLDVASSDDKTKRLLDLQRRIEEKSKTNNLQLQNAVIHYHPDPFELYNTFQPLMINRRQRSSTSPSGPVGSNTSESELDRNKLLQQQQQQQQHEPVDSSAYEISKSDQNIHYTSSDKKRRQHKSSKSRSSKYKSKSKSKSKSKAPETSSSDDEDDYSNRRKQRSSTRRKKLTTSSIGGKKRPTLKSKKSSSSLHDDSDSAFVLSTSMDYEYDTDDNTSDSDSDSSSDGYNPSAHSEDHNENSSFYESDSTADNRHHHKKSSSSNKKKSSSSAVRKSSSKSKRSGPITTSTGSNIAMGSSVQSGGPVRSSRHHHASSSSSDSDSMGVLSYPPERINESSNAYIVEIDDKIDEDKMCTLLDFEVLPGFSLCNTEILPGQSHSVTNVQLITAIRRVEWDVDSTYLNTQLSMIFNSLYESIIFKLRELAPCNICGINVDIKIPEDDQLQLLMTAMCVMENEDIPSAINTGGGGINSFITPPLQDHSNTGVGSSGLINPLIPPPPPMSLSSNKLSIPTTISVPSNVLSSIGGGGNTVNSSSTAFNNVGAGSSPSASSSLFFQRSLPNMSPAFLTSPMSILNDPNNSGNDSIPNTNNPSASDLQFDMSPPKSPIRKTLELHNNERINELLGSRTIEHSHVEITPLSYIPGSKMLKYLGRVNIHLIKESFSVREEGGLGVFSHVFVTEANAILRAHVRNMGGNALVSYHIDEFNLLLDSGPKGQAYSLLSISGDAFYATGELIGNRPPYSTTTTHR